MKDGTKRDLDKLANFEVPDFDQDMILDWAQSDDGAGLPHPAAVAFTAWLDSGWTEYDDPERDQTNLDILKSALSEWTGGRVYLEISKDTKAAFAKAEKAHAALYDPDCGDEWRRGPHPIALADFFAAVAATGLFEHLAD